MASRDVRAGESRMPPEVVFALMSLCFLGVNDFLYKWGQQWEMRSGPFMFLQNMAYLPNAFGLAYYRDELILNPGLAFGFINGILAFTAFLFVLLALKRGEAVALVPIVRLNFAVTAALTIFFLGESVNLIKGVALVLAALAVTAGGSVAAASVGDKRSVGLAIGAMCMFGVIGLFYKLGLGMGAKPAMMTAMQKRGRLLHGRALPAPAKEPASQARCAALASIRVRRTHLIELRGHRCGVHVWRGGRRGAHRAVELRLNRGARHHLPEGEADVKKRGGRRVRRGIRASFFQRITPRALPRFAGARTSRSGGAQAARLKTGARGTS